MTAALHAGDGCHVATAAAENEISPAPAGPGRTAVAVAPSAALAVVAVAVSGSVGASAGALVAGLATLAVVRHQARRPLVRWRPVPVRVANVGPGTVVPSPRHRRRLTRVATVEWATGGGEVSLCCRDGSRISAPVGAEVVVAQVMGSRP